MKESRSIRNTVADGAQSRFERLLQKHLNERAKPKKRPGRRPVERDISTMSIDEIRRRISCVNQMRKRAKTAETIRRWDEELKLLRRRRRFLLERQRANRLSANRRRTEAARAERARQKQLDKAARTKEAVLSAWETRDHTRFKSWLVDSTQSMKANRFYRWTELGWAMLTPKVIKHCGFIAGDINRDSRVRDRVRRFDGTSWQTVGIRDLPQLTPDIVSVSTSAPKSPTFKELLQRELDKYGDDAWVRQTDPQKHAARVLFETERLQRVGLVEKAAATKTISAVKPNAEPVDLPQPVPSEPMDRKTVDVPTIQYIINSRPKADAAVFLERLLASDIDCADGAREFCISGVLDLQRNA